MSVTSVTITGELPVELDFRPYVKALTLKLLSEPVAKALRVPKGRPKPGQPPDEDFYEAVVGLHNRFVYEGEKQPSAAVARLMGETPEQVRLWTHRGQKYLKARRES